MIEIRILSDARNLPDPLSDSELCAWLAVDMRVWREWRAARRAPIPILILRDGGGIEVDALTSRAAVVWWYEELPAVTLAELFGPADFPDDQDDDGGAL